MGSLTLTGVGKAAAAAAGNSLLTSLISYYKMDEASGNALDAHSVGPYDLTANGLSDVGAAAGKINGARDLELDQLHYFTRADNADLSTGNIDFTGQIWVNLESELTSQVIAAKDDNGGAGTREWQLYYLQSDDRFHFVIFDSAGNSIADVTSGSGPTAGTWYLIHFWHDATADQIGIAINDGTATTAATGGTGPTNSTGAFYIGKLGGAVPFYYDGLIDEAAFWKKLLTSDERTLLYNGGAGYPYSSFT